MLAGPRASHPFSTTLNHGHCTASLSLFNSLRFLPDAPYQPQPLSPQAHLPAPPRVFGRTSWQGRRFPGACQVSAGLWGHPGLRDRVAQSGRPSDWSETSGLVCSLSPQGCSGHLRKQFPVSLLGLERSVLEPEDPVPRGVRNRQGHTG